jgi:hypothetical protein
VSLSLGFVLGRGRVQRACACACGVEGSYSRSSECQGPRSRLATCLQQYTNNMQWQQRWSGVAGEKWSADDRCLADVSPMGMGMGINRGVGTKEAQVCTRSRSTMTSLRVCSTALSRRGRSRSNNLEELHRAERPKQANDYISYVCLLKDQHSCSCT